MTDCYCDATECYCHAWGVRCEVIGIIFIVYAAASLVVAFAGAPPEVELWLFVAAAGCVLCMIAVMKIARRRAARAISPDIVFSTV